MSLIYKVKRKLDFSDVADVEGNKLNCEICGDSDPALKIYESGNWKCHSCKAKGGDLINYIAQRDGISNYEAAKQLIQEHELEIEVPNEKGKSSEQREKRREIQQIQEEIVHKAQEQLEEQHYQDLDERRNWSKETVDDLRIGWMDEELFNSLKQEYGEKLGETGIHYGMTGQGDGTYLIPHLERNDQPYLITCRDPNAEEEHKKYQQAKSSGNEFVENDIYKLLKNNSDTLILTEGYPDAISAYEAGYDTVAAACGSFEGHLNELKAIAKNYRQILIVTDNDDTGRENARQTGDSLVEEQKIIVHEWSEETPEKADLDDWTTENGYDLEELIEDARHFLDVHRSYSPADVDSDLVDIRISVRGKIKGQKQGMGIPWKVTAECPKCGKTWEGDMMEEKLLHRFLLSNKNQHNILKSIVAWKNSRTECIDDKNNHSWNHTIEEYLDKSWMKLQNLLQDTEQFNANQNNSIPAYIIGEEIPNSKSVKVRGEVHVNSNNDQLVLIGDEIEPEEQSFQEIELDEEEHEAYNENWTVENACEMIAADMVGRPLARKGLQLTAHSPPLIPNIEGKIQRGSLRLLFFGDGGTYKSEQIKELTKDHYRLGEYASAETGSRTGLVYTINTEQRVIEWGVLPLNDMGLVGLDGLNQLHEEEMKNLREILEDQRVNVNRSVKGSAPARVRIIGAMNPPKEPISLHYPKPAKAIKDTNTFSSGPDIRRWDLYIPFLAEDVTEDEIAQARASEKPYSDDFYKKHVLWAWSLKPQDIQYTDDAKERIRVEASNMMKGYNFQSIPVVSRAFREKLTRLCVAQAVLEHAVEDGKITVIEEHVERVKEFFEKVMERLGMKSLLKEEREKTTLDQEKLEELVEELSADQLLILKEIGREANTSGALAEKIGDSKRTVKEKWQKLKAEKLVATKSGSGVRLEPKGIQFLNKTEIDNLIDKKREIEQNQEEDDEVHELHRYTKETEEGGQEKEQDSDKHQDIPSQNQSESVNSVKQELDEPAKTIHSLSQGDGWNPIQNAQHLTGEEYDRVEVLDVIHENDIFETRKQADQEQYRVKQNG